VEARSAPSGEKSRLLTASLWPASTCGAETSVSAAGEGSIGAGVEVELTVVGVAKVGTDVAGTASDGTGVAVGEMGVSVDATAVGVAAGGMGVAAGSSCPQAATRNRMTSTKAICLRNVDIALGLTDNLIIA